MLTLIPVSLKEANAFVAEHHRHHKPVTGHKFSIGCQSMGRLVGVAIVGRPVSRYLDDGLTLEVTRLCTTGERNACSMLYAARGPAQPGPSATGKLSPIRWILNQGPVSLPQAGSVPGKPEGFTGRANAARLSGSTRLK